MKPTQDAITIDSRLGPGDERSLHYDVLDGLHRPVKELPPKHFYDAEGSRFGRTDQDAVAARRHGGRRRARALRALRRLRDRGAGERRAAGRGVRRPAGARDHRRLRAPPRRRPRPDGNRMVVFLGGTLGNFLPGARRRFLRSIARQLEPDDRLLLGTDLVKDPHVLQAAYDDSQEVTAAFNRNVLTVVN